MNDRHQADCPLYMWSDIISLVIADGYVIFLRVSAEANILSTRHSHAPTPPQPPPPKKTPTHRDILSPLEFGTSMVCETISLAKCASVVGVVVSSLALHLGDLGSAYRQFGFMPKMEVHTCRKVRK